MVQVSFLDESRWCCNLALTTLCHSLVRLRPLGTVKLKKTLALDRNVPGWCEKGDESSCEKLRPRKEYVPLLTEQRADGRGQQAMVSEDEDEKARTRVSPVSGKPSPRDATSLTPLTGDWHVQTPAADTSPVPAHSLPLPLPFPVPTDVRQVVVPLFEKVVSTSGTRSHTFLHFCFLAGARRTGSLVAW